MFITLSEKSKHPTKEAQPVTLNTRHIVSVHPGPTYGTDIVMTDGNGCYSVTESFAEVCRGLRKLQETRP